MKKLSNGHKESFCVVSKIQFSCPQTAEAPAIIISSTPAIISSHQIWSVQGIGKQKSNRIASDALRFVDGNLTRYMDGCLNQH
jgi:hypothetical protein